MRKLERIFLRKDGRPVEISVVETDNPIKPQIFWEGLFPPMFIRVSKLLIELKVGRAVVEGVRIPPWYYGLSYYEDYGRDAVFHIMPFNWLIRALRWFEYMWARFRCRRSWFDAQMCARGDEAWRKGYEAGRRDHERDLTRKLGFK